MITLATLFKATAQEVFVHVATHLVNQGKVCGDVSGCKYRVGKLKCAAGCLISDSEYEPGMDKGANDWPTLIGRGLVQSTTHDKLIIDLQNVHDQYQPSAWKTELEMVGAEHNLDTAFIEAL